MKLAKVLENNISSFKKCKTPSEIFSRANWIINHNSIDDKHIALVLQKCLKKSKSYEASMIYISSFMLTNEKVSQKTATKKSWYKGTSIHGMECSNPNR